MQRQIVEEGIQEIKEYNQVLQGNKHYVQRKLMKDPEYFTKLSKGQQPKYLLIGCSDSRAPPNEITETDPGEIFIHRNIANLVIPTDLNMNCVLQYAIEHLKVHNVIVMGHTCCGGIKAAMKQQSVGGLLDLWLNTIKLTYEKHQELIDSFDDEEDKANCLSCMSVREQVMNIWRSPIMQKSWSDGHPIMVHGWLFRVETGYIEELSMDETIPQEMSKVFSLTFDQKRHSVVRHSVIRHSTSDKALNEEDDSPVRKSTMHRFQRMQSRMETTIKKFENIEDGIAALEQLDLVTEMDTPVEFPI